jgi:hypothetical protein
MPAIPSGAREVDPAAETAQFAVKRSGGPVKVLNVGDVVRVYGPDGGVFTGQVAGVDGTTVVCAPLEEEEGEGG